MDAPRVQAITTWTRTLKYERFTDITSPKFRAKDATTQWSWRRQERREDQIRRGVAENVGGGPAIRTFEVLDSSDRLFRGSSRVCPTDPTSHADATSVRQTMRAGD